LWQLQQTLPQNLEDNWDLRSDIEFVLVDFDSNDGLREWVLKHFKNELTEGYLKYFFTKELMGWHASIAKNTAHLLASGNVLTNLDCDNFTGKSGAQFVLDSFENHNRPVVLHQFRGGWSDGSFGRISVHQELFSCIGGYDEKFAPMGFQDLDLMVRLYVMGVEYVSLPDPRYNAAIPNSKEESIAFCNSTMAYLEMNKKNRMMSLNNILLSRDPVRNNGLYGIRENIVDHSNTDVSLAKGGKLCPLDVGKRFSLNPPKDLSFILKTAFGVNTV
jgi:hypothetical protein